MKSCDSRPCHSLCSAAPIPPTSPSGEATGSAPPKTQLGIFDVFKIGIGPSSSHTVGPMAAAVRFLDELTREKVITDVVRVQCDLYGSLALTGIGHGSDKAVCVGLAGEIPSTVAPDDADEIFRRAREEGQIKLGGKRDISFKYETDMIFNFDEELPQHPNGMKLTAFDAQSASLYSNVYLSIGGGFVKTLAAFEGVEESTGGSDEKKLPVPYPFRSASELMKLCQKHDLSISQLMIENEKALTCNGDETEVLRRLDHLKTVFMECIERGMSMTGLLPVSGMRRQANEIWQTLKAEGPSAISDHFAAMDWITLYARSVNEENACGGRIVTSPTNGAAGTLPAVLAYYINFFQSTPAGCREFLATAAAFATIIKTNASISGAEAGCQAEVGSACAMAAAGLTAVRGGHLGQIENAAEIALEHNLGMTCDPIGGLVQVPCIERNCVAAVKAVAAHRLAMRGNGHHEVSFDSCVEAMYRTGLDMQSKYRETSQGGLAIFARRPSHCAPAPTKCRDLIPPVEDGESTTASIRRVDELQVMF